MPHATMKLIPGIDTIKTPVLNEAAFSYSENIRFMADRNGMGIAQKLGGWVGWGNRSVQNVSEIHPWQDLYGVSRLAIGAYSELSYITNDPPAYTYDDITPQQWPPSDGSDNAKGDETLNGTSYTVTIAIGGTVTVSGASNLPVPDDIPVYFKKGSGATLPSPITEYEVYFAASANYTSRTFTLVDSSGSPISTIAASTGTITAYIPTFVATNNSSQIIVTDTEFLKQSVTCNATTDVITAGYAPDTNTVVTFNATTMPTGLSKGTKYYVLKLTDTTFQVSTTVGGSAVNFTTNGTSVVAYLPDQILTGFGVNYQTPVSIGNRIISGGYTATGYTSNLYYSCFTIDIGKIVTVTPSPYGVSYLPTFDLTSGTSTVTVTQPNHPYQTGDIVTFVYPTSYTSGSNTITIYGPYTVTLNASSPTTKYEINASTAAPATTTITMNNGNVHAIYYYNIPSPFTSYGYGYGGYGENGYGQGVLVPYPSAPTIKSNDWTIANFGEVLLSNPEGGPIYYWAPSQDTQTAFLLSSAPLANNGIFVTMPARQIVAYGSTETGLIDPLLVRWSDAGDATSWTPTTTNLAGSYRIPEGSSIVGAIQGPHQAVIWTDLAIWLMQFVGGQNVYGFNKIADGVGLIGKKAAGVLNGNVFWMSPKAFNLLASDGPKTIPCPVWDNIFQDLNTDRTDLIRCATNSIFNEVTWYYPSYGSTINDRYVKYNTNIGQWDYGSLSRLSWTDQSVLGLPIGVDQGGNFVQHEIGYDNNGSPMVSSFQTGYMQLNEADNLIFIDQIWPDFKWQTTDGQSSSNQTIYLSFYGQDYPDGPITTYGPYSISPSTTYISTRIRNRLLSIGISTSNGTTASLNNFFRIGAIRYRYQLDGRF